MSKGLRSLFLIDPTRSPVSSVEDEDPAITDSDAKILYY